jgi:hypothetical protein
MANEEKPIEEIFFDSGKGKYEVTKLAIEWIKVVKKDDDYRKLSQTELLDKAVRDVLSGVATYEKIEEIKKRKTVATAEKQEDAQGNAE